VVTAKASRVKRARAMVDLGAVSVLRKKKGNRQRAWRMPSASVMGSWYEVFAKFVADNGIVRAWFFCNHIHPWGDCEPDSSPTLPTELGGNYASMEKCDGNRNTVCYHCLAAMVKLAKGRRMTVQFVDSRRKAQALARLGTVVEMCGEGQVKPKVWAVMRKRGRKRRKCSG